MNTPKTVLITGAGKGLGLELVNVFQENKWKVIATARNPKNIEYLSLDVTSQESIDNLARILTQTPIDVLINNAGILDSKSVDDESVNPTVEEATEIFRTNVIGARVLSEKLVPNLEIGGEKLIVSITSAMGTYANINVFNAGHWPYSASKIGLNLAMISFTKIFPNIKSVLIIPGWMKTEMGGQGATVKPEESAQKIYDLISNHREKLPNGKLVNIDGKYIDF